MGLQSRDPLCRGAPQGRQQGLVASGPREPGELSELPRLNPRYGARGLQAPVLVTTDGAPGLIRAVTEVWGHRLGQRCLAHKTPNIRVTCLETLRWRSSDACAMSATPSPWRWPRNEQLRFLKTTTRGIQRR